MDRIDIKDYMWGSGKKQSQSVSNKDLVKVHPAFQTRFLQNKHKYFNGTAVSKGKWQQNWLRHYATCWKVAGLRPDGGGGGERIVSIYLNLPAALGPGVYSTSNRNWCEARKKVSGELSAAGV
jgi:hypothetical protein